MKFKVACVQINPIIGQVENNISKIKSLLSNIHQIDLIILPELAITGYNFSSKEAIKPYLESSSNGKSVSLAKEISDKYKCFTLIGYPEVSNNLTYNSAVLVGPGGSVLYNYRKTFLYETDEVWGCNENPEKDFESFELVLDKEYYLNPQQNKSYPKIVTNIGICMDLNPYKFKSPFNKFEMSLSCFSNKSKLILCPMAWLSPQSPSTNESLNKQDKLEKGNVFKEKFFATTKQKLNLKSTDTVNITEDLLQQIDFIPQHPDYSTINYWILRFFPFLNHPNNHLDKYYQKVTLITCNRIGVESEVLYGGSSSIIHFKNVQGNYDVDQRNPSVEVIGSLGQGEEGVLFREIEIEES